MPSATRLSLPKLALLSALTAGLAALVVAPACAALRPPLSVQWTHSMGPQPRNLGEVVISGGLVFVSHGGALRCLDARTGGEKWRFEREDAGVSTAPLAWRDLIIVGVDDGYLCAVEAVTGEEVWQRELGYAVSPDPIFAGGELVVAAGTMAFGLDPATGHRNWVCSLTSLASAAAVSDGAMLYFLCQDGAIRSIDQARGRLRWQARPAIGPAVTAPIYAGRRMIVAGGRRLAGISRSGKVVWTADMPVSVTGRPTVAGDTIYVPCADGTIQRLYVRSGQQKRVGGTLKLAGSATAAPVLDGDVVIGGTGGGLVCALADGTGETLWQYRCRSPEQPINRGISFGIYAPLVSAEGALYCLTGTGDLYCFTATAGDDAGPQFGDFDPEPGDAISSEDSLVASFTVLDDGSGVVPTSVRMSVDGIAFPVAFDPTSGVATVSLGMLSEGSHVVTVSARDHRGNTGEEIWSFLTDESIAPASAQPPQPGAPGGAGVGGRGPWGVP